MTREKAAEISRTLNDICDFENFMDEIYQAYINTEGDFEHFFREKLEPLLNEELERRRALLEVM